MKLNRNKRNKPSLQGVFVKLWIATILSFIFTLNTNANAEVATKFFTIIFLANILIGIVAFIAMLSIKKIINLNKTKFITCTSILAIIYFLFYVTAITVNGQGFIAGQMKEKKPLTILPTQMPTNELTPTQNAQFPLGKLYLGNYSWKGNYFSGEITNNYSQHVTNVEVKILVSKSRKTWEIGDEFTVTIENPIWVGESVSFRKYLPQKDNDPWYTTRIIAGLYYYGDKPSPTPIKKYQPENTTSNNTNSDPWGIARQIDEKTWTMKVGQDERIGTPQEIFDALNVYRSRNGRGNLTWDDNLATFAQSRAAYFNSIKNIDKHVGFNEYVSNTDNLKKLGFWGVGENCNYGQRLFGVHLIEWIYAGDKPHDDNQLSQSWTHVGIGVEGLGVSLIFGNHKM